MYYKKALYYNWHYADAMYNLGVAYGEMLKFEMVSPHCLSDLFMHYLYENISSTSFFCASIMSPILNV